MTRTLDLTAPKMNMRLEIGDDQHIAATLTDTDTGEIPDLSDYTEWQMTIAAPDGTTLSFDVDDSDQAQGLIYFNLEGELLRGFPRRGCVWDIACKIDGRDKTLGQGRITLKQDVSP